MHRGDRDLNDDDQQVVGGVVEIVEVVVLVLEVVLVASASSGGKGKPAYGSSLIADKNLRKSLLEGFAQWIN